MNTSDVQCALFDRTHLFLRLYDVQELCSNSYNISYDF